MFAAMLGAISAMDKPMACQTDSDRRNPLRCGDIPGMSPSSVLKQHSSPQSALSARAGEDGTTAGSHI
jgi:hypothetical protein